MKLTIALACAFGLVSLSAQAPVRPNGINQTATGNCAANIVVTGSGSVTVNNSGRCSSGEDAILKQILDIVKLFAARAPQAAENPKTTRTLNQILGQGTDIKKSLDQIVETLKAFEELPRLLAAQRSGGELGQRATSAYAAGDIEAAPVLVRELKARELAAFQLPANIDTVSTLSSLSIASPIAHLSWAGSQLTQLSLAIDENGAPFDYPASVTDLSLSGHADNVGERYDVDFGRLPKGLTSLTVTGVHLLNTERLPEFSHLRQVSLRFLRAAQQRLIKLPPSVESLETDALQYIDLSDVVRLQSVTIDGGRPIDLKAIPASVSTLSLRGVDLMNVEALAGRTMVSLSSDDPRVLGVLPRGLETLRIAARATDGQSLKALRSTRLTTLSVTPAREETSLEFDVDWLPQSLVDVSFSGVTLLHPEHLSRLTALKRFSFPWVWPWPHLPSSVEAINAACLGRRELGTLPRGLRRLSVDCLDDTFAGSMGTLQRLKNLRLLSIGETSDFVDFEDIPARVTSLTVVAPYAYNDEALKSMVALETLSLVLRPGVGGSPTATTADLNESSLDASVLPTTLKSLRLIGFALGNPKQLERLDRLEELTVDRRNRAAIVLPHNLKRLTIE